MQNNYQYNMLPNKSNMDIKYTPTHTPPFLYVAMLNSLELGKKTPDFSYVQFPQSSPSRAVGGSEEFWPKRWA